MTDNVRKARLAAVKSYCKSILWIDDEIDLSGEFHGGAKGDAEGGLAMRFFADKVNQFASSGALCHLQGFAAVSGKKSDPFAVHPAEDQINVCCRLAESADVVMIDWFLGNSDSSECSENIIAHLTRLEKFRFIVILTYHQDAAKNRIGEILGGRFKTISDTPVFCTGNGQFVVTLDKEVFKADDSNLYNKICDILCEVYADYLHIAAIELLGNIRMAMPQLLASLPDNADLGIQFERAATMKETGWESNLQAMIIQNLFEDIGSIAINERLDVLSKDSFLMDNCSIAPQFKKELEAMKGAKSGKVRDAVKKANDFLMTDTPQGKEDSVYKTICNAQDEDVVIAGWRSSIECFSGFCDTKCSFDADKVKVYPGCVYYVDGKRIAVCVSAACDCVRDSHLLFLIGQKQDGCPDGGKGTCVRFGGSLYKFAGSGRTIRSVSRRTLAHCKLVGALRKDVVNRLIDRFYDQMQRVGVNQPSVSRRIRNEGDA